jgi:DNA polymerase-3 subunit delta
LEEKPVVFILHGDDTYGMEQYVTSLCARMGDPGLAELNTSRFDARSASDEDIRTAATSMPFLAERRLTILTHAFDRQKSETARQKFLMALVDRLPSTSALVWVQEDGQRWNKRLGRYDWEMLPEDHWLIQWAHKVGKRAFVKEFLLPRLAEMPAWIMKHARDLGGEFLPGAAAALAGLIGSDTQVAGQEIDKLLMYVDRKRPVEEQDVIECTAAIVQVNVFAMADAMAAGDASGALRMLSKLLEEEDPIRLFGAIVYHFRGLLLCREILEEGGGVGQMVEEIHLPRKAVENLSQQAARFSLRGLENIYRQLEQMDEDMKSGVIPPHLALETFVVELASLVGHA